MFSTWQSSKLLRCAVLPLLLQNVGHLNVAHTKLGSLAGLTGLTTINGDLIAWDNANLTNLQGLGPVSQLFGKLWMDSNPGLQDLTGLEVRSAGLAWGAPCTLPLMLCCTRMPHCVHQQQLVQPTWLIR